MTPTQPKFIDMPFCYNGARNEIPTSGGDDGSATLNDGFPTVTEQPISQGGIPPRRKDFNGILYALSNFQFFAQAGGIYTYSEELDYRTPAMVWYGGNLYICIKNNGASSTVVTPGTNSDYWKDFVEFLNIDTSVAQRLGTATVGSGTKHMYLNAGSPVASSSTVGGTAQPMWLNAGTMTAMSATVGGTARPIYANGGTLTACSATVGASDTPVWLNAGTLTACDTISSIIRQSLGNTGYIEFSNGLVLNWARLTSESTDPCEYTKPIEYNTYVAFASEANTETGGDRTVIAWLREMSTTTVEYFETARATGAFNVLMIGKTV